MLNKDDLLDSLLREIEIARHLSTKVPPGGLEHRLSEGQRTTLELQRYLCFCGVGGADSMYRGSWDGYKEWEARCANLKAEEIPAALDQHADGLKGLFAEISAEQFDTQAAKTPLGEELSLGRAMLEIPLKWMTAYRMQLFLQAKAAGNDELWTANCWAGIDMPRDHRPS